MSNAVRTKFLAHFICFLIMIFSDVVFMQRFRQRYFTTMDSAAMTIKDRANYTEDKNEGSLFHCAATCELSQKCAFFDYNHETELCHMTSDKGGAETIYFKYEKCPADKGYILWVYNDMALCVKYKSNKENNTDSRDVCKRDDGHLFLIESEDMRQHLQDLLDEQGVQGVVYLDGFDDNDEEVFPSWKGTKLPWERWASLNPNHGSQNCIKWKSSEGFILRDTDCFYKHPFLCQIGIASRGRE